MDIREALLAEHSKRQTMKIVNYIDGDPAKFKILMGCFLGGPYRLSQRAAWAVNYCAEHHKELVKPYFGKFVEQLERDDVHVAVRRNVARTLQFIDIPKRYEGRVFEACYQLLSNPAEMVAVRCFSMSVAAKIAKDKPELMNELRVAVSEHPQLMTAGLRSRARRVLGI